MNRTFDLSGEGIPPDVRCNIWYRDAGYGGRHLAQGTGVRPGNCVVGYLSPHSDEYPGLVRRYIPAELIERIEAAQ